MQTHLDEFSLTSLLKDAGFTGEEIRDRLKMTGGVSTVYSRLAAESHRQKKLRSKLALAIPARIVSPPNFEPRDGHISPPHGSTRQMASTVGRSKSDVSRLLLKRDEVTLARTDFDHRKRLFEAHKRAQRQQVVDALKIELSLRRRRKARRKATLP